jgi:hypothetical protein
VKPPSFSAEGVSTGAAARVDPEVAGTAARAEILRLQQALFRRQQRLLNAQVHGYTPVFRRYEARYRRRVAGFERTATMDELVSAALAADVVHVGDYHTLQQAQAAFVKLVGRVAGRGREVVLALESVEAKSQPDVDRYLAGRLGERGFLARVRRSYTRDTWPNVRPIFDAARALGLRIVALERSGRGSLSERDRFWARRIAGVLKERPEPLVMALTGQLHCAPPHLPAAVRKAVGRRRVRQLVVYQNAERVSWQLAREGHAHDVEAVRLGAGEYCLVNTSPLVVQQSFLDWLEGGGDLVETSEPERRFKELARGIAAFLGIEVGDAVDGVEVFTAGDLSFLVDLRASGLFSARELALIERQILAQESYYIPKARIAYLATLSLSHAAEEAAHFLRHMVTGDEGPARGLLDSFYGRTLEEAYAFFASKIVNPCRRAPQEADFERLRRSRDPGEARVAALVLSHKAMERGERGGRLRRLYRSPDVELFHAVTHSLGYILGDQLYSALVRGTLPREEARELFLDPLEGEGDPSRTYFALVERFGEARAAGARQ